MNAINDSFLLRSFIFRILKNYFKNEPYYVQLVELFIDVRIPRKYTCGEMKCCDRVASDCSSCI